MPGFMSGGFGGDNMMTPAQRSAALHAEAKKRQEALRQNQLRYREFGTHDPILIQQIKQRRAQQAMAMRNQQLQMQGRRNAIQQQQEADARRRMGQTLQGRQMIQRGY